ncbi:MAG: glycosyltransferase family 4 protein [Actinomycetota bacterium]|nr:glycosyltransferase family 4 protein [Actinomycetota bacterium]
MKLIVITPHFAPDVAATGVVVTRIVEELGARGHRLEVFTSLPWYRHHSVEEGFGGRLLRYEDTPWGRITRIHPLPTADKRNLFRRAASFVGFSALCAALGARGGDADGVLAVSPPLTLGLAGAAVARARRAPFVFNVQDVYPDVAIELGVLTDPRVIRVARKLERSCYDLADAITVLSEDLKENVDAKLGAPGKTTVIPNFVDTGWIVPGAKENPYRRELGLSGKVIVMYAGNIGLSQPLEPVLQAAAALAHEPDIAFVINGQGAARPEIERKARGLDNVHFVDLQPVERLPEVLAAADIHLVPLKRGLARSSVPSKTYSILAAGRPLIASVDRDSEVAQLVERTSAGLAVAPEDPEALTKAISRLVAAPEEAEAMGGAGRRFVEGWASPSAVAESYEDLFRRARHRAP